ncbi:Anthranilate synthase component 1 [uncultured archaeon]|nr:Anthranilate synthase component 1 [uncultured archaeon]
MHFNATPERLFFALAENYENAFLLESSNGPEKIARFSFAGFGPKKIVHMEKGNIYVDDEAVEARNGDPLDALKAQIPATKPNQNTGNACTGNNAAYGGTGLDGPKAGGAFVGSGNIGNKGSGGSVGFLGGAVGYFSFEFFRQIEGFSSKLKDETHFPDFEFGIFNDAIIFDHATGKQSYVYIGENRAREVEACLKDSGEPEELKAIGKGRPGSKQDFVGMVEKAKERIVCGDIFQAVLSRRHSLAFRGGLGEFYRMLKVANPSPYLYFMKFGKRQLIGSSPENLFRVEGNEISSYATIAGTRPRGKNTEDDRFLEEDLLSDPKERAEHLMLVDLTRNDVGKVAKPGTVKVPELMHVHKYSHVQHLASFVKAELAKGKDSFDAFRAIFPAGTVSGAPKIRATEIIGEL